MSFPCFYKMPLLCLQYAFELLDPILAIYDDLEEMVDKAHPNARDRTAFVTQTDVTVPGASAASGRRDSSTSATVDGPVGGDVPATDLAQLSRRLSETLIAVSAAADRLHDIAEEQAQVRPCGASIHALL